MNKKIIIALLVVIILIVIVIINNSKSGNKIEINVVENKLNQNNIDTNESASVINYYVKFNTETQKYEIVNSITNNVEFSYSTEYEIVPKYKELTGNEYMH